MCEIEGTLQGGHAILQDTLIQLFVPPVSLYVTHLCLCLFICVHPSVSFSFSVCTLSTVSQPVSTSLGPVPLSVCIVSLFALSLGSPVGFDPLTLSLLARSNLLSSQSLLLKPSLPGGGAAPAPLSPGHERRAFELGPQGPDPPINQPAALGQTSISTNQPGQEADTISLGLGVIRPRLNHRVGRAGHPGT